MISNNQAAVAELEQKLSAVAAGVREAKTQQPRGKLVMSTTSGVSSKKPDSSGLHNTNDPEPYQMGSQNAKIETYKQQLKNAKQNSFSTP